MRGPRCLFSSVIICLLFLISCSGNVENKASSTSIPIIAPSVLKPNPEATDSNGSDDDGNVATGGGATIQSQTVATALYGFGGMYSSSKPEYKNPATNDYSCPVGYSAIQVHGSEVEDAELWLCQKKLTDGELGYFDFGGMYGTHSSGEYQNPITGDSSCPSGFNSYPVYGDNKWDYNLYYCAKPADLINKWGFGFGGMFGEQRDNPVGYPHPQTQSLSCPASQTEFQVLGSNNQDWPLYFCAQTLKNDLDFENIDSYPNISFQPEHDRGYMAFGGMYSQVRSNPSVGTINPATNDFSCPTGYTAHQVQGKDYFNLNYPSDANLFFCYKENQERFETAVYDFGGMFGVGILYYANTFFTNPLANDSMSCPDGFISKQVLGGYDGDYALSYCYREQKLDQATPFSFGGMYSDSTILTPAYPNIGGLGTYCPTGHTSYQVHGANQSKTDVNLYMCTNSIP